MSAPAQRHSSASASSVADVPGSWPTSTDLDLYHQIETDDLRGRRWPVCPHRRGLYVHHAGTGLSVPARCGRISCHACIWPEALNIGAAIGLAQPAWFVTLTRMGADWQEVRGRMMHFKKSLNRADALIEYAWHVEPNPGRPGHHVHLWAHGASLPKGAVAKAVLSAGGGFVHDLSRVHAPTDGSVPSHVYGMKSCRPPDPEVASLWPEAAGFLKANGGRLASATRNFWRDLAGRRLGQRQRAVKLAREAQGRGSWVFG